jgi:Protein of unknown function DUF262
MPKFDPNQKIASVLKDVNIGTFRIPNIQRGYEWDAQRVLKLLDSIMNGYPIGAIMIWQPSGNDTGEIRTRAFIRNYDSEADYLTTPPHASEVEDPFFVLDGQQRLQSLYLSFYGGYNGRRVFLQVDHRPTAEDEYYRFEFLTPTEVKNKPWMVALAELVKLDYESKGEFVDSILAEPPGPDTNLDVVERRKIVQQSVDRFEHYFKISDALLFQIVPSKIDYDHVLEIFERVNSGGMVLSKSDLLFCTLKLQLAEAEEKFNEILKFLNQGNRHQFSTDFLIKICLVVFDKGSKYEIIKLKDPKFVKAIEDNLPRLHVCLRQMYAWLEESAYIKCARFLRSQSALIPIVYFMMASGNIDKPDGENSQLMTEYLHMAFIKRLFGRSADNIIDRLHSIIKIGVATDQNRFPIDGIRKLIVEKSGVDYNLVDNDFLTNADLMLNIVDGGRLQQDPANPQTDPKDLKLEIDHIFPRKILGDKGLADVADHLGNYRLIVMYANRRKSSNIPDSSTDFFGRRQTELEPLYQMALAKLDRESFLAFRDARFRLIKQKVTTVLGLSNIV